MKVVFASTNAGKIRELRALVQNVDLTIIPQAELGVSEIPETGLSFIENALLKARHACRETGLPAIADDSGLSVKALQGAPGIYSARYAGLPSDSKANIEKLLEALKDVPVTERQASFHCLLVYLSSENDPTPLICEGRWKGYILEAPQGNEGFGYDPIFGLLDDRRSAAELPLEIKNQLSHRAAALHLLISKLPEKLGFLI